MEDVKDLLDWLAATPTATLYYREGKMQRHQYGRAPIAKAIHKGERKTYPDMDEMIIHLLMKNPGMELQLFSADSLPPYWIVYTNCPRKLELPKTMFIENGAVCFKRADGKNVMATIINP